MAVSIAQLNLINGQEICLPFEVTGTVTPDSGLTVTAGAKQIDDNEPCDISEYCEPDLLNTVIDGPVNFNLLLTRFDCPFPDTFYILTLLFWDDGGEPSLTQENITFKVAPIAACL